jgi:hypothetical protein
LVAKTIKNFNVHHIDEGKNISFAILKLEGHALTWWEIQLEKNRLAGDLASN